MKVKDLVVMMAYEAAITEVRKMKAKDIKENLTSGLNMLFDSSGNFIKFGIDSLNQIQVKSGLCKTKTDVIFQIKKSIDHCKNFK